MPLILAIRANRGARGVIQLIPNFYTAQRSVINFTSRPLNSRVNINHGTQ